MILAYDKSACNIDIIDISFWRSNFLEYGNLIYDALVLFWHPVHKNLLLRKFTMIIKPQK